MALRKQNPQIQLLKKILSGSKNKKSKFKLSPAMMAKLMGKEGKNVMRVKKGGLAEAIAKLRAQGLKKGGSARKKFPDFSGDGKVTMKDVLMGRGVIKKKKPKKKGKKK